MRFRANLFLDHLWPNIPRTQSPHLRRQFPLPSHRSHTSHTTSRLVYLRCTDLSFREFRLDATIYTGRAAQSHHLYEVHTKLHGFLGLFLPRQAYLWDNLFRASLPLLDRKSCLGGSVDCHLSRTYKWTMPRATMQKVSLSQASNREILGASRPAAMGQLVLQRFNGPFHIDWRSSPRKPLD